MLRSRRAERLTAAALMAPFAVIYGVTTQGGTGDTGTVFAVTP